MHTALISILGYSTYSYTKIVQDHIIYPSHWVIKPVIFGIREIRPANRFCTIPTLSLWFHILKPDGILKHRIHNTCSQSHEHSTQKPTTHQQLDVQYYPAGKVVSYIWLHSKDGTNSLAQLLGLCLDIPVVKGSVFCMLLSRHEPRRTLVLPPTPNLWVWYQAPSILTLPLS